MKLILVMLVALLGLLQYELWFARGGMFSAIQLHQQIQVQEKLQQKLSQRNQLILADIDDLKHGGDAVEAHARYDLGMIKQNEVYYQLVQSGN